MKIILKIQVSEHRLVFWQTEQKKMDTMQLGQKFLLKLLTLEAYIYHLNKNIQQEMHAITVKKHLIKEQEAVFVKS